MRVVTSPGIGIHARREPCIITTEPTTFPLAALLTLHFMVDLLYLKLIMSQGQPVIFTSNYKVRTAPREQVWKVRQRRLDRRRKAKIPGIQVGDLMPIHEDLPGTHVALLRSPTVVQTAWRQFSLKIICYTDKIGRYKLGTTVNVLQYHPWREESVNPWPIYGPRGKERRALVGYSHGQNKPARVSRNVTYYNTRFPLYSALIL